MFSFLKAGQLPVKVDFNHGGGLLKLEDQNFLYCWPGGESEADQSVKMWCSHSSDFKKWSEPSRKFHSQYLSVGSEKENKSLGNVVLHQDSQKRIWMFYGVIESSGILCKSWTCGRVDYRVSYDNGETWSEGVRLDDKKGSLPRNKVFVIEEDLIALPLYFEREDQGYLKIIDLSKSTPEKLKSSERILFPAKNVYQPSIDLFKDQFFALFRDTSLRKRSKLFVADYSFMKKIFHASLETQDNVQLFNVPGVTHAKTSELPNPRSALDTIVDNDKLFVFYNHSFKNRSRLSVACTKKLDGTFSWMYDIENSEDDKDIEWAYPYVIKDESFAYMIYSKDKSELHSRKVSLKKLHQNCQKALND